jgi:hypothetical protein
LRRPLVPARLADFSSFYGEKQLADRTIKVKIHEERGWIATLQVLGAVLVEGFISLRRLLLGGGAAEVKGQEKEVGVVVTMQVHGAVLVQRSAYFNGLLLGGGAAMAEGKSKTLTVELADEQGALVGSSNNESIDRSMERAIDQWNEQSIKWKSFDRSTNQQLFG